MKHLALLFKRDIHALEYDPGAQYKFHFFWTWAWAVCMVALPFLPKLWAHQLSALVIIEVSLWANFATHFGAMSSALAAKGSTQPSNQELKQLIVDHETPASDGPSTPTEDDIADDFESGLLE
jgi:hypothetical protein